MMATLDSRGWSGVMRMGRRKQDVSLVDGRGGTRLIRQGTGGWASCPMTFLAGGTIISIEKSIVVREGGIFRVSDCEQEGYAVRPFPPLWMIISFVFM
ncbi:hypothetical protein TNCV_4293751 [Trichonephila clavipes]|uniref:Uncharacterized protein n=1 Tax=Trichonephila clavipes TaxID=2585209 RepID=A0A8X6RHN9_TRICX|nr:hypothetical protein TNCV_4293751 [Trichonephila clavipes]